MTDRDYKDGRGDYYLAEGWRDNPNIWAAGSPVDYKELLREWVRDYDDGLTEDESTALLARTRAIIENVVSSSPPSSVKRAYIAGFLAGHAFDSMPSDERIEQYAAEYVAAPPSKKMAP